MPALSDLARLPLGAVAIGMKDAREKHAELVNEYFIDAVNVRDYPFAALNLTNQEEGLFFYVPKSVHISVPIHVLSLTQGNIASRTEIQNLFVIEENAQAAILQEYANLSEVPHFTNSVTVLHAQAESKVQWIKHQHENTQSIHLESYFIQQAQNSDLNMTHVTQGAALSRDDVHVTLKAKGAVCKTSGFYHTWKENQYADHHVDILHLEPNTQSEMLYKGIIDKKSRAVFNGRLYVAQNAQRIQAVQGNHHLLLSPFAEAYSKPELEIYADDVKCRHGATTGQIDQDALFYLRARGIDEKEATRILMQGFADDVLKRVQHPVIQHHIRQQVSFDEK
jgi:Fe-S cluster assembly protein SufD